MFDAAKNLAKGAYRLVTTGSLTTKASAEFTTETFNEIVFTKNKLLANESESKFIEALKYCNNLSISSRQEAFLLFDATIIQKKDKVEAEHSQRKSEEQIFLANLRFCFRFLPFLIILIYQDESDSLAPSSEQILLNYFNDIKNNFDLTLRVLPEFSKDLSNAVKTSVLRSLEAILFPSNKNDFFTNRYWQRRFDSSGRKNFSDFPIYLTYLTLLKHWNATSDTVKSVDPIRAFFSNGRNVQISYEYTEIEIINIANSIIKMKYEFPYIMENIYSKLNFILSLELIENWAGGRPRFAVSLHFSVHNFDSVVKPVIKEVFLSMMTFLSPKDIDEVASLFPESFIRYSEVLIPPSVISALKFVDELSSQADEGMRIRKDRFCHAIVRSIAKYLFKDGVSRTTLIQIFDKDLEVDSGIFRDFEVEIVKLLTTPPNNDNVSLKLFLRLSPDLVLAEDIKLRTLVFPVITSSAKRTILDNRNLVTDLHILFEKYFLSKMNEFSSIRERCKLLSEPILEIFKVFGMDQIRNKYASARFFWFILAELSRVSVNGIKPEEFELIKMEITQSFLDGENRRVVNKLRNLFQDDCMNILTNDDPGLLKADSPLYFIVAQALGKLYFDALTSSLPSTTAKINEIQKTLRSLNSRTKHVTPIAVTYVVEGINYVHHALLENRLTPPKGIQSFAYELDQYIKGLANFDKFTELETLSKAREKFFEYAKAFEKDIEEGNFNRNELLTLTGEGIKTRSMINVSSVVDILSSFTEKEQKKDQKAFSDFVLTAIIKVLEKMTAEEQKTEEFISIIDFLDGCRLLGGNDMGSIESKNTLMNRFFHGFLQRRNDISLKDLVRINEQFEIYFKGEIISDQSFASLRKFAKQSNLYMKAFRAGLDQSKKSHERDARVRIDSAAAFAINNLNNLVLNEDSRINDFQLNEDFLKQFQKDQQQQKTRETELNLIVEFFQTAGGRSGLTAGGALSSAMFTTNSNVYKRLTAAFDLNRYLLLLDNLIKALNHLNLNLLAEHIQLSDCYQTLQKDNGNFKISQSLELLESLLTCIGKLSLVDIQVLIRVGSSSSALLLDFFQKKGEQFGPTVNNAKQVAVRNPHLLGILAKLESVHQLLQPFWSTVTVRFTSFQQLKKYFDDRTLTNDVLIDIDEVIKYFPDIQDYLIEEHDGKSSDIVRIAMKNLKGQYQSSLRSHLQGESFSLLIKSEQFSQEIDHRKLEEQVQWARLAKSSQEGQLEDDILQCFIEGYEFAKEVHTIRLLLESLGHPDYQEDAEKELNPRMNMSDASVESQLSNARLIADELLLKSRKLRIELNEWRKVIDEVFRDCPRLRLLKFRSRVQLLRLLKNFVTKPDLSDEEKSESLLSFVCQCIPELLNQRPLLIETLDRLIGDGTIFLNDRKATAILQTSKRLLNRLLTDLDIESDLPVEHSPVRLVASDLLDLYGIYSRIILEQSITSYITVWGDTDTSGLEINDTIEIAKSGVCSAIFYLAVDRMSPAIREQLLRGLQSIQIHCQVYLLFIGENGLDAFQHYESRDPPATITTEQSRLLLWNSENIQTTVVGGGIGMGKSTYIKSQKLSNEEPFIHIWVHEGFSVTNIIDSLRPYSQSKEMITLHFEVMEYGSKLSIFARFLQSLLISGQLIDEENGNCFALLPNQKFQMFFELPAVKVSNGIWPLDRNSFHVKDHPYLQQLPVISTMVPIDRLISIKQNRPLILDHDHLLVYHVFSLLQRHDEQLTVQQCLGLVNHYIKNQQSQEYLVQNEQCHTLLNGLFSRYFDISIKSKKVQNHFIKILASRCHYFLRLIDFLRKAAAERIDYALSRRLNPRGQLKKLLTLFCLESKILADDSISLPRNVPVTIRPEWVGGFEVILFSADQGLPEYQTIRGLFPEMKVLQLNSDVEASLCSEIAPAFGLSNEGELKRLLERHSHVMTFESTLRLLYINEKRELGTSIICQGDTGCGKTKTLDLLSVLLNSSSKYYFNLRLHIIACLKSFTEAYKAINPPVLTNEWLESIPKITPFLPLNEFKARLSDSLQSLNEGLLHEFCVTIHIYFQLLFINSLYEDTPFLLKYLPPIASYIKSHPAKIEQIASTIKNATKEPILHAELCSMDERVLEWIQSLGEHEVDEDLYERLFADHDQVMGFYNDLLAVTAKKLFYRKLADEALSPVTLRHFISALQEESTNILKLCPNAKIVVFIDELNTAGCIGMVSELFLSHSIDGKPLSPNIFFVGAINPYIAGTAEDKARTADCLRMRHQEDENKDYLAYAPYIVKELPPNLMLYLSEFDNLTPEGEKRFLREYFHFHMSAVPGPDGLEEEVWTAIVHNFCEHAVKSIAQAQATVRSYRLPRVYMSIRNLIHAVEIFKALMDGRFYLPTSRKRIGESLNSGSDHEHIFLVKKGDVRHDLEYSLLVMREALVMSLAVGYLFQLPSEGHARLNTNLIDYRSEFLESLSPYFTPDEFKTILNQSLNHLFGYAKIPKGLAKTNALMENFYAITLTAMLHIPLLITGPPGCGKTLAYMLVCDCLQGESDVSVPFQFLKKIQKKTYQCSAWTTASGISNFLEDCYNIQKVLRDTLVLAGFDEAGLVPENRQALKTMHDILDQRLFGIVMMSNTTLDAAKTSRTVQLLQTQATSEDLDALAWGILVPDDLTLEEFHSSWKKSVSGFCRAYYTLDDVVKDHWFHSRDFVFGCRMLRVLIDQNRNEGTLFTAEQLLMVLRRHFQPLNPGDFPQLANHFLQACGFAKPIADDLGASTLKSLRKAFQDKPLNPYDPTSAHCRYILIVDPTDSETSVDILKGLQLFDSTLSHPARDGETFASATTCYQSISDFPEDKEVRRQADVLGEISNAIETGKTLLLSNSGPIQSSLYDLINRYYQILTTNGNKVAFTNIALGSFSRQVRVHPEFRLVIIVKKSEVLGTPLPFLNRFEKYTLSIQDVFQQRLSEVIQNPTKLLLDAFKNSSANIKEFFQACQNGLEGFYEFLGKENAFYGVSDQETISAILLQYLEDMVTYGRLFPTRHVRPIRINSRLKRQEKMQQVKDQSVEDERSEKNVDDGLLGAIESKSNVEEDEIISGDDVQVTLNSKVEEDAGEEKEEEEEEFDAQNDIQWCTEDKPMRRVADIIKVLNFKLLLLAKVQSMFRNRHHLSPVYLKEYIEKQNHFDVVSLLQSYVNSITMSTTRASSIYTPEKLVIYTRTDAKLIQLSGTTNQEQVHHIIFPLEGQMVHKEDRESVQIAIINSATTSNSSLNNKNQRKQSVARAHLIVFQLSSFQAGSDCEKALSACFESLNVSRPTTIIVVANMKQSTANQITSMRHLVDHHLEMLRQDGVVTKLPTVLFLLHVGANQLNLKSCYQSLPLNSWNAVYIDAFTDYQQDQESFSLSEGLLWMKYAFQIKSTMSDEFSYHFGLQTVAECFYREIVRDIHFFPFNIIPQHVRGNQRHIQTYRKTFRITDEDLLQLGVSRSTDIYCRGNLEDIQLLFNELQSRKYLMHTLFVAFAKVWSQLLEKTVEEACDKLAQGITTRGLISEIKRSYSWLLSDFLRTIIYQDLARDWALEALLLLPEGGINLVETYPIVKYTTSMLDCIISTYNVFTPQIGKKKVECNFELPASKLPLYGSFFKIVQFVLIQAKTHHAQTTTASRKRKEKKFEEVLSVILYQILPKYPSIQLIVQTIQEDQGLFDLFVQDFIKISLQLGSLENSLEMIDLLKIIAFELIRKETSSFGYDVGENPRSIWKWMLLSGQLQSELNVICQLLNTMNGTSFYSQSITSTVKPLIEGSNPQNSDSSVQLILLESLVLALQTETQSLAFLHTEESQTRWLQRIRDLISFKIFSPEAVTDNLTGMLLINFVLIYKMKVKCLGVPITRLLFTNDELSETNDFSLFAMQLMSRLLLLADSPEFISLNLHLTCIEAIEDCILWLANCPLFLASSCFPIVVCCLLSLPVPAQFEHYAEFQEIFENISISVKCELIRQFLSQENAFTNANELELFIDYALTLSSPHSIDNISCANYIPPFVLEGNTEFFQHEVFPGKPEQRPIDQACLTFVSRETETVIFRAYYFLLANKAPSLRHACSSFRLYMDQIQRRDPTDGISIILLIKRSIAIFEVINKFMERVSMINTGVYMNEFEARDLDAVRQAISLAPQTWAIYLLTRLNENSQVITFLHDQDLLNALNLQWWFYHPTIAPGTVNEANAAIANREQLFFAKLLTGIRHARMMILHASHQLQLEIIPSLELVQNYSAPVDESTQHMIDCCRLLMDEDLAYNKYLPTIIAMHSFMKDKFDYFFVNEEEVRTTLVVDALNRLPIHDQLIGKDLFKQFLATWRILKDFYQVFYVCPNELRGGDTNHGNGNDVRTEIIDLTAENTYVSFLVEIPGTTEHESFTSRMIEKVLVYKLDQALSSPCIESLANQNDPTGLNPSQLVFENPKHLKKAKLSSIGSQSNSILTSNILTGACSNPRYKRKIENYLSATISWEVESEPPSIPDLSRLNAISTNLQDYMQRERDRLAAATQLEYAMINEATPVNGRKFIICPNCNIIFEKADRCASVICAWSYHAEHRSSATNPGCGHAFNQANQLVQRPGNGVPIHPYFYELRPPIQLPSHLTNTSVTDIPEIPLPVIQCKVNWKALLQELLLNELHKKASFDLKNDNFFQPLQYLTPTVLAPPQIRKGTASNSTLTIEKKEKSTRADHEKQATRGNLIQNLSSLTSYNVYVRLLIISEHIQALLHEYITSICSNDPKLQELDIINSLTSELIRITPGQTNSMDNYLFNRDELVIHDITYQFYSFCEFFLRKSYEIIEEYHPFLDISKSLDLSRDGLQGLIKIIESKEECLLSFYIDQYDQLLSSSFSSSKVQTSTLDDRMINDENDVSDGFMGKSAASSSSLVCISGDFKRIIKRFTLFQIPLIAQFLANQGISGSNEIRHSSNPLLPSMILFDENFQTLLQNQLSSITFNNLALIRKELLELSSIADIMSDINELKLLTSELQKYSEEFLDFYEFTSFGTYFEENHNSLSLMIQQCSKESLLYRIMIGSEGSLLQLKHANILMKYLRKLISELEYENLKFLQQQWLKKQQQKNDQKGEGKQQQRHNEFKGMEEEDNKNNHRFHFYSETIPKAWEKSQLPSLFEDVTMQQRSSTLSSSEVHMSLPSLEVDFEDLDEEESIDNDDPWRKVSSVSDRFRQRMKGKRDSYDEIDSPNIEEEGFIRIEVEDDDEDEIEILPMIELDERIGEFTSTVSEKIVEERKSPPPSPPLATLLKDDSVTIPEEARPVRDEEEIKSDVPLPLPPQNAIVEEAEEAEEVNGNNEALRNRKIWAFISASVENGTCYCWNCLDIVNAIHYNDITDTVAPIIHNHDEEEGNTQKIYQCSQCRLLNCLNCYEKEYEAIRRQMIDEYGVEDESSLNYIEDQDYIDLHDSSDLPIIAKRRFLTVCQIPNVPQPAGKQRDITKPDVWKTARASILKALLAWKKVNPTEGGAMNSPLLEKKREEFYQFIEEKGMIQPEDIRYLDENEFLFFTSCFKKVQMRQIIDSCVI